MANNSSVRLSSNTRSAEGVGPCTDWPASRPRATSWSMASADTQLTATMLANAIAAIR
ncbi:hypothetical protein D3C78_1449260 [compost metagenome]